MGACRSTTRRAKMPCVRPTWTLTRSFGDAVDGALEEREKIDDELESDDLGVRFMLRAGYNPEEMIGVMEILKSAAGPNRVPERMSTHPDPENHKEKIRESIEKYKNAS